MPVENMIEGIIYDMVDRSSQVSFWYMPGLTNTVEAIYEEVAIPGRSLPHTFYQSTSLDKYNFRFMLTASDTEGDERTARDVWKEYLFLKSFQFPDYGGFSKNGPLRPPRLVLITIGSYFSQVGLIKAPSFSWEESTVDSDGYPHRIECLFTFDVHVETPLGLAEVRADYRRTG